MALDFASIASQKVSEIERPPLAPAGTYRFKVTKLPSQENISSDKGEWDVLTFFLQAQEAMEDVDPDLMEAYGDPTSISQRLQFFFDKNDATKFQQTLFRLRTFLEKHLGCISEDDTIASGLNAAVGAECLGTVTHVQDKNDKDLFHANLGRTAPVA